jgi:hypothetical protein
VKVRRIVSNIAASDIEAAKCSYHDMLGLDVMMDLGWARPTSIKIPKYQYVVV